MKLSRQRDDYLSRSTYYLIIGGIIAASLGVIAAMYGFFIDNPEILSRWLTIPTLVVMTIVDIVAILAMEITFYDNKNIVGMTICHIVASGHLSDGNRLHRRYTVLRSHWLRFLPCS